MIYERFDDFVAEKYSGNLFNKMKNAMGKRVPELDQFAGMFSAAEQALQKPQFIRLAGERREGNPMSAETQVWNAYNRARTEGLAPLFKLLDASADIKDAVEDVKVLQGSYNDIRSSLDVLANRLVIKDAKSVNLKSVVDKQFQGSTDYFCHWGFVGSDYTLEAGQASALAIISNLRKIFAGGE
jgi:hypothetical protein